MPVEWECCESKHRLLPWLSWDWAIEVQAESNGDRHLADDIQTKPTESPSEIDAEQSEKSETNTEQETPTTKKSYAELARSGTSEWIDVMANRRTSVADEVKTRSTLPRRNSRTDRGTPPNGKRTYKLANKCSV